MAYAPDRTDYNLGTSDNPKARRTGFLRTRSSRLEQLLVCIPPPVIHNEQLDLESTNQARITWALKYRVAPIIEENKVIQYRIVSIDEQGLVQISYTLERPSTIQAISEEETIPLKHGLMAFDLTMEQLNDMVTTGRIRMIGKKYDKKVYLADLGGLFSLG